VVLVAAWVILAGSRFVQGGVVERPERVPQLYGYTMCLVGLLWALTSVVALVESATALAAPAQYRRNEFGIEPSVTSFEAFRLTYDRARRFSAPDPGAAKLDTLPEPELRRRFEAYRADRIAATEAEARQGLVTRTVSLALGAGLFAFHWRWLRRKAGVPCRLTWRCRRRGTPVEGSAPAVHVVHRPSARPDSRAPELVR
jgi:hypothetical protein